MHFYSVILYSKTNSSYLDKKDFVIPCPYAEGVRKIPSNANISVFIALIGFDLTMNICRAMTYVRLVSLIKCRVSLV